MLARDGYSPFVFHLHDIEQSFVEEDIKRYLTNVLGSMPQPPSSNEIERLAKRAGKLFIYAATAARYINPDDIPAANSRARLLTVLGMPPAPSRTSASTKQYKGLDALYTSILSAAFNDELEAEETTCMELVLRTVICTKEPMTAETMASLLGLTKGEVEIALEPLWSVLHVPEAGGLVAALHASFPDYLLDSRRSGIFYCNRVLQGELLASCCFGVMERQLRFNICKLESSFVFDKDVVNLNERIKSSISPSLSYSCQYWGEHLGAAANTKELRQKLLDFLSNRLLFWMEVLNLKKQMGMGPGILRQVKRWLGTTDVSEQIYETRHGN